MELGLLGQVGDTGLLCVQILMTKFFCSGSPGGLGGDSNNIQPEVCV